MGPRGRDLEAVESHLGAELRVAWQRPHDSVTWEDNERWLAHAGQRSRATHQRQWHSQSALPPCLPAQHLRAEKRKRDIPQTKHWFPSNSGSCFEKRNRHKLQPLPIKTPLVARQAWDQRERALNWRRDWKLKLDGFLRSESEELNWPRRSGICPGSYKGLFFLVRRGLWRTHTGPVVWEKYNNFLCMLPSVQ